MVTFKEEIQSLVKGDGNDTVKCLRTTLIEGRRDVYVDIEELEFKRGVNPFSISVSVRLKGRVTLPTHYDENFLFVETAPENTTYCLSDIGVKRTFGDKYFRNRFKPSCLAPYMSFKPTMYFRWHENAFTAVNALATELRDKSYNVWSNALKSMGCLSMRGRAKLANQYRDYLIWTFCSTLWNPYSPNELNDEFFKRWFRPKRDEIYIGKVNLDKYTIQDIKKEFSIHRSFLDFLIKIGH